MYQEFFALDEAPFNVNPSPRFLYLTREIQEALAGLMYGINNRKGFVTLIGEVGTGKTTLLNGLLEWLKRRQINTAFIFNSRLNTNQLLEFILTEFHIPCESRSKVQQLVHLNQWLLERHEAGKTAVLIVDEAQNLTYPVLEEIRLLTNLETSEDKLLQVILSGQLELYENLNLPQLRQLRQRIGVQCKTSPLSREQTHEYVAERLRIAGAYGPPIFTTRAIDMVHKYSRGIPRVINLLCEHALVHGYVEEQRPIEPAIVDHIAREFRLEEIVPIAAPGSLTVTQEVYNTESFVQNLGEALSLFRLELPARERK